MSSPQAGSHPPLVPRNGVSTLKRVGKVWLYTQDTSCIGLGVVDTFLAQRHTGARCLAIVWTHGCGWLPIPSEKTSGECAPTCFFFFFVCVFRWGRAQDFDFQRLFGAGGLWLLVLGFEFGFWVLGVGFGVGFCFCFSLAKGGRQGIICFWFSRPLFCKTKRTSTPKLTRK